jgi:hypothetical protein
MKKLILSFAVFSAMSGASFAQTRLALYQEFTGENCYPCSVTNPGLDALINASGNSSKVLMLKYLEPIPTVGMFYYQDRPISDAALSYYSVPFTPYGRMNGMVLDGTMSSPGHPGYMVQADIDAAAATPANFNISVSSAFNSTRDSVTSTITVTCVTAYTSTNLKLRTALVEDVYWPAAPADASSIYNVSQEPNSEKYFDHVVRAMYPSYTGTDVSSTTWTAGTTQTYTITGAVPNYVDKNGHPFVAVWLQDDAALSSTTGNVLQAAKSAPLTTSFTSDIASDSITAATFYCSNPNPTLTLSNTGTSAITNATIYYKLDKGSWSSQAWSGSLAAGASTNVTLALTGITAGTHVLFDSVVVAGDINYGNNNGLGTFIQTQTGYTFSQVSTGFESSLPTGYITPSNADGEAWARVWSGSSSTNIGHNGSQFVVYCDNPDYPHDISYLIIPTPTISGTTSLDFAVAYAQQNSSNNDELALVHSSDCGTTWTSIWSKSGAALATAPASPITGSGSSATGFFIPTSNSQWAVYSVDLTSIPATDLLAFRNTADGGNYIFLDDIKASNFPASVNNVSAATSIDLFPNPAKDMATLQFNLATAGNVQVTVVDVVGRTVSTVINGNMNAGAQKLQINTADLAAGVYTVKITTDNGVSTERLSVVK